MLNKKYFCIIANLFITTVTSVAMEPITEVLKPQSAAYLHGGKVAVAGKGCIIFDAQSRKQLCTVTQEEVFNMAANKDRTLLALSTNEGILFHHVKTGTQARPNDYIHDWNVFVAFGFLDNTLFSFRSSHLFSYNSTNSQITKKRLKRDIDATTAKDFISCHPAKNEIMYMSGREELSIVQPEHLSPVKTKLQTNFRCASGDYAPDGHTIALFNPENGQYNYFICNLDAQQYPLPAHQLIVNDKNYCASAFDPQHSLIFLLSEDGYIHCFDYIQRLLIAATRKLSSTKRLIDNTWERRRLDCDQQGKYMVAALKDTWAVLDIPQNNFYTIWQTLYHNGLLPKELVKIILCNIVACHQQSYEHFDLKALLDVTPIKPAICEQAIEDPLVLETEIKLIQGVYVRQPKTSTSPKFCINTQRWTTLNNL